MPNYIQGEWCGVSYQAYVDFISQRHDLAVYTVDTDYGCGVIRKLAEPSPESATAAGAELLGDWRSKRDDPMEAFAFLQAHKQVLLNLITTDEFFRQGTKLTAGAIAGREDHPSFALHPARSPWRKSIWPA
mgnify:CR=1 FL=1